MTTGETPKQTTNLPAKLDPKRLPPLQLGRDTPEVLRQVYGFYSRHRITARAGPRTKNAKQFVRGNAPYRPRVRAHALAPSISTLRASD